MIVYNLFIDIADYSSTDLVTLTQKQMPWINAYIPHQNNEITLDAIKNYFLKNMNGKNDKLNRNGAKNIL